MEIVVDKIKYGKILNGISLKIKEGNITSIIGTNGSGKSILLECLNDEIEYDDGKIDGIEKKKTVLVRQNLDDTFFCDTIEKEIELTLEEINYPREKIKKRITDSLKMIGLPEYFLKRDPITLSSSELRLVALSRALSTNPDIILLDEPTIGMTPIEIDNLIQIIKKIKRRYNKTIILVTQDMELVHKVSDYIYVIKNGMNFIEGDKYTIFKQTDLLLKNGLSVPNIINFEDYVLKNKGIKLGYRDEINDLIKDILRNTK